MKFTKITALVLTMVLCLGLFAGCSVSDYTAKNTKFVIGLSGPLTGPAAMYGEAVKNSAEMAVKEINAAGGLDGVEFEVIAMDDMHDSSKVSGNYAALLEKGMQVSLGTVTTKPGLEWKNLSKEDNVFFLTPSASGDDIPANENGYQMCFADSKQGVKAAEYVNESYKDQTIGIFYKSDDDYSKGIYQEFKNNLDASVKTVEQSFTSDNETNFTTQINNLKDCKFIFMPIYYTPAAIFMKSAVGTVADDAVYYGCDGFDGIDSMGEDFDITKIPQAVIMLSHFNSAATEGPAKTYIDKYKKAYPDAPLNQFGASAYDCVYAIYGAMKAAVAAGEKIDVTISASKLCDILKEQFSGGYALENGVTTLPGEKITWAADGYVNKVADKYVIKEADAK